MANRRVAVWGRGPAASSLVRDGEATDAAVQTAARFGFQIQSVDDWSVEVEASDEEVDAATRHDPAVLGWAPLLVRPAPEVDEGKVDADIYEIRLPEACYEPRRTLGGGEVRDVVPYDGAVAYVTDGRRYGVRFEDGRVDWLGDNPVRAFGEGVIGFYGTDYATYYVAPSGRIWLVQSDEDDPATLPRVLNGWDWNAVPCDDLVGADWPELLRGVEE